MNTSFHNPRCKNIQSVHLMEPIFIASHLWDFQHQINHNFNKKICTVRHSRSMVYDMIIQSLFRQIKDPKHPLHYLLPPVKESHSQMVLWPTYPYQIPLAKTSCYGRDFLLYCISKKLHICCIIFIFRFVLY